MLMIPRKGRKQGISQEQVRVRNVSERSKTMKHERYCPIADNDTLCPPLCRQMEVLRAARETKELLYDIKRLVTEIEIKLITVRSFSSDA